MLTRDRRKRTTVTLIQDGDCESSPLDLLRHHHPVLHCIIVDAVLQAKGRPLESVRQQPHAMSTDQPRSTVEPQPPGSKPQAQKISASQSHSRLGTLWSRQLPEYTGDYSVGAVDVEVPIEAQRIGNFQHRKLPGTDAGIEIDTVLFTLFYPCEPADRELGAVWFPR